VPATALSRGAADSSRGPPNAAARSSSPRDGRPTAVLHDVVSDERRRRALQLLKILAQGDRDHDVGHVHDTAAVDTAIRDRLAAHRDQASTHTSTSSGTTSRARTPVLGTRSPPTRAVLGPGRSPHLILP
jgi:hypothetical protein